MAAWGRTHLSNMSSPYQLLPGWHLPAGFAQPKRANGPTSLLFASLITLLATSGTKGDKAVQKKVP